MSVPGCFWVGLCWLLNELLIVTKDEISNSSGRNEHDIFQEITLNFDIESCNKGIYKVTTAN